MAVTELEATDYATARGLSDWTTAVSGKPEALRRGQDYIAGVYNGRWATSFTDASAPTEVKYAICEAAIRELKVPFSLTPDIVLGREKVLTEIEGVKWSRLSGDAVKADDLRPTLTAINDLLRGQLIYHCGPLVA